MLYRSTLFPNGWMLLVLAPGITGNRRKIQELRPFAIHPPKEPSASRAHARMEVLVAERGDGRPGERPLPRRSTAHEMISCRLPHLGWLGRTGPGQAPFLFPEKYPNPDVGGTKQAQANRQYRIQKSAREVKRRGKKRQSAHGVSVAR